MRINDAKTFIVVIKVSNSWDTSVSKLWLVEVTIVLELKIPYLSADCESSSRYKFGKVCSLREIRGSIGEALQELES
jgi:hypothetical protein